MSDSVDLKVKLSVESSSAANQIKQFNNELKTTEKEIKSLDTGTKNFQTNMSNMGKKIDLTSKQINTLNDRLKQQKIQLADAEKRYLKASENMDKLGARTRENGKVWDAANKELKNSANHYQNVQREIRSTEVEISNANKALTEMKQTMAKMPYENLAKGLDGISSGLSRISQVTAPLSLGLGTLFTKATTTAIDFEEAMAEVGAISGVAGDDLERLSEKARQIGSDTQLSASEGAEALKLLAQA